MITISIINKRLIWGEVISIKMKKTIIIKAVYKKKHPLYEKNN